MTDRPTPSEALDEVARTAQEHGDYDDPPPLDGDVLGAASRADLLAALGAEWWCDPYRRGEKPSPCVPRDPCATRFWYCHWAVPAADATEPAGGVG